ncbi:hypothetical protein CRG98_036019 [Punica granatum]|uniref:Uncharacterized protein n=1 Tax=Punica granatum TaxID=22663 RepID=A0A2I0IHV9_PUNGR|nr:hypothetical protein CRG98_036019 [Punica granatum]
MGSSVSSDISFRRQSSKGPSHIVVRWESWGPTFDDVTGSDWSSQSGIGWKRHRKEYEPPSLPLLHGRARGNGNGNRHFRIYSLVEGATEPGQDRKLSFLDKIYIWNIGVE